MQAKNILPFSVVDDCGTGSFTPLGSMLKTDTDSHAILPILAVRGLRLR